MKILHINTQDYGGAAKACIRINHALNKAGVDSKVLVLHKKNNQDSVIKYEPALKESFLNTFTKIFNKIILNIKVSEAPFSPPFSGFNICKSDLYKDADVVNLHWVSSFLDYKSFFKYNNKKNVWTLHDMNPFTGGNHYSFNDKFLSKLCTILLKYKIEILRKNNVEITIVSPSKWLMELSKQSELFSGFKHFHIRYAIDIDTFKIYPKDQVRKDLGISLDKRVLLFVADSMNEKRKGFQYLIESLEYLENKEKIQIVTIGSDFSYKDESLDIKNFGFINDESLMAKIYSAADIFVIPSLEDNLPNTVIESLACGTPVVGFDVGGIPEIIDNENNGAVCLEINSKSLALKISDTLNKEFDRKKIRSYTIGRFSEEVISKKYIDLYESLNNNS